jgi:N-acetylglucosaminyl-diphospho-decaprenol L-rhamnosyltransferase
MPSVSVVVVSFNSEAHIECCLSSVMSSAGEVVVVDCASADGSAALVRERFPQLRLLELESNAGYGAATNEGARLIRGDYLLLLNPDAWAIRDDAVTCLASFLDEHPHVGLVGPRLLNPDGTLQPSVRGFPTLWRLATEYFFLRWFGPRSRLLNSFYGNGFDHRTTLTVDWVKGAVMLVRRDAFDQVEGFDPAFFMFNEEVDLCRRLREASWDVVFTPAVDFVHVGGASTGPVWSRMYREQLRSHLRFLAKHDSIQTAERARLVLLWAMRLRSLVLLGNRRRVSREACRWLATGDARALLASTS